MPSIYDWSTTAASNANADGSIDWSEGMAPSEVNDSARFMMARVAEYVTDIGGSILATGTANAILVTTESAFTTYADGRIVSFRSIDDNTGAVTLSVNSIGTKPIVKFTSSGETALVSGDIQEDAIYTVQYSEALNSGNGAWVLLNPTPQPVPTEVPAGAVSAFAMSAAPTGWLKCDGAAVSRTTYAALFAALGTTWGPGDGSTTFNVPDLRGEFIRGWADSGSVDSGRTFASAQAEAFKAHNHTASTVSSTVTVNGIQEIGNAQTGGAGARVTENGNIELTIPSLPVTVGNAGGTETRPRNKALLYCIKT